MDSHIQVPNSVLKRFRDKKSNSVHYLDLNTGYIRTVSSSKLGTSPDYYSAEFEQYLNREVEDSFARFTELILKNDDSAAVELLKDANN